MQMLQTINSHSSMHHGEHKGMLGSGLARLRLVVRKFRQRRELRILLSLPDHALKDIGLQRADVEREVLKPLWKE
jgi:uncharacterized protein YjiS (DUF1127 family)